MIFSNAQSRPIMVTPTIGFKGFDLRVMLFLGLICFLLFWSFWGKALEKRFYGASDPGPLWDNIGAVIIQSPTGGHEPVVIVEKVQPDSPAELAGLKPGDRIIGINGQLVSSLEMTRHMLRTGTDNNVLKLTIARNSQNKEIYARYYGPLLENRLLKRIALKYQSLPWGKRIFVVVVFFKLVAVLFFLLYHHILKRTSIVLLFAMMILFAGIFFKVYTPMDAFFAIKFNTISLLLGMGIISVVMSESGFFGHVAVRVSRYAGGSHLRLLIGFCLMTYLFSLLFNNLITIMIMVPMTLKITEILQIDPRPIIIGQIISSNLGGASTMVGDFPNMLIASEAGIGFAEFIIYMMPICLILLGVLLVYLKLKLGDLPTSHVNEAHQNMIPDPPIGPKERRATRRVIFVLCHVLFLFLIADRISLNSPAVALFGGLSLFLFSGIDRRKVLSHLGFNDMLFFVGLFIVVGGLEASGLQLYLAGGLSALSFGKPWILCTSLMWSVAILTAFLNAGPTAALFFPIVMGFTVAVPHHVIWWALSLGVLAGSSATIFGATAGPVAISLLERSPYGGALKGLNGNTINFGQFAKIGIPVMILFLSVSSVYIIYLCFHA